MSREPPKNIIVMVAFLSLQPTAPARLSSSSRERGIVTEGRDGEAGSGSGGTPRLEHGRPQAGAPSGRVKENQGRKGLIQTVDASSRLPRFGKGGRDLHHERLAEAAEDVISRFDVPRALGDIVIVFVDDDPASLEVAETGPPALDFRYVESNAAAMQRLRGDGESARCVRPSFAPRTATATQVGRILRPSVSPRSCCHAQR
jgi:hypothetical protein